MKNYDDIYRNTYWKYFDKKTPYNSGIMKISLMEDYCL